MRPETVISRMSAEHPLTEEQLDALVNELQDRLGDSAARKVGRRGVLAALGVAALGTGSASAQASGSVGTASSPVDVFGYDVDASNSFTDPAGVTHSGELADLSDVGASGQWQEVNSGSNIEPIDGETVGTGSEDVDVGSVSTGTITDDYLYAGAFGGSDPDARLDNALNAAVDGKTIFLEQAVYDTNHTISKKLKLIGLGTNVDGTKIESTIDLSANNIILGSVLLTGTLNVSGYTCIFKDSFVNNGTVNVSGSRFRMYGCHKGDVTFQSGTTGGVVDASTDVSVTDNGNNVGYLNFDAIDNNRVQAAANDSLLDPLFANGDKGLLSIRQEQMRQDGVTSDPGPGDHLYALAITTPPNTDSSNAINVTYEGGESALGIGMKNSNSRSGIQLVKNETFSGPLLEFNDRGDNGGLDITKAGGDPIVFEDPFSFDGSNMDVNVTGRAAKISVDSNNDPSFTDAKMIFYKHGDIDSGNETEWLKFKEQESENYVEVHVDDTEVMRIRDNGDLDLSGSVNENAF